MRSVWHSISVGPPPSRAFSIARFASRYTASTSVPSMTTPSNPYASARSATCSVAYSRCVGDEYAHWLLSQTKTIGSLHVPVLALRRPVGTAHVLREDSPGLDAAHDVHAHVAVQRRPDVAGAHRRRH